MLFPFMMTWFIVPLKLFEFIILHSVLPLFIVNLFVLHHISTFLVIIFRLKIASSTVFDVTNAVIWSAYM